MDNTPLYDEAVRAALEAYATEHELTHEDIAKRLGFSTTRVTKFLNLDKPDRQPERDSQRVEIAARNFLRHISRRSKHRESLFEDSVSESVFALLRQIRRTGDIGLIHSEAGVGKTCACELFCRENPNSVLITASRYRRDARAIERALYGELALELKLSERKDRTRGQWMEDFLRGSERIIIIDNAHRLHRSGLEWLFDFHDISLCAIALVGNPEVLALLRHSDQLFSRIGIVRQVRVRDDAALIARKLIEQLVPESNGELLEPASDIINRLGHVRTLKKQLALARDIREGARDKDWLKCFNAAAAMLVKPN